MKGAFAGNTALQGVIDSVHARYQKRELSMDEMDMVFAAGQAELPVKKDNEKNHGEH